MAVGNGDGSLSDKDTLLMLSGVALVVFGTGLILSSPIGRRYLGQIGTQAGLAFGFM